jgi:hypothetical protein
MADAKDHAKAAKENVKDAVKEKTNLTPGQELNAACEVIIFT